MNPQWTRVEEFCTVLIVSTLCISSSKISICFTDSFEYWVTIQQHILAWGLLVSPPDMQFSGEKTTLVMNSLCYLSHKEFAVRTAACCCIFCQSSLCGIHSKEREVKLCIISGYTEGEYFSDVADIAHHSVWRRLIARHRIPGSLKMSGKGLQERV